MMDDKSTVLPIEDFEKQDLKAGTPKNIGFSETIVAPENFLVRLLFIFRMV